jgi:hypothetical protein
MRSLHVMIRVDGQERAFHGEGDGPELVAAFRVWLASSDNALPDDEAEAEEVDRRADEILRALDVIKAKDEQHKEAALRTPKADLEVVWDAAMERRGEAPGLSSAVASAMRPEVMDRH